MTEAIDIRAAFVAGAREAAMDCLSENESELDDAVSDYEDETGEELDITPAKELERGGELSDPAFADWCKARVEEKAMELAAGYESAIVHGRIKAWRAVMAEPGWDARAAHVGVHWSVERAKAQPIFGDDAEGKVLHVVEAWLPIASVDWNATLRANLSSEFGDDEDEIRLLDGAPYEIVRVHGPRHHRRMPWKNTANSPIRGEPTMPEHLR